MTGTFAVLLDGTWDDRGSTAVWRLAKALKEAKVPHQYEPGVQGVLGGLVGKGFGPRVNAALDALAGEEPERLLIVGGSRGGAEAVALANRATLEGLAPVDTLLCLFDPVPALAHRVARPWSFSPPAVRTRSALALDEARRPFWPLTWSREAGANMDIVQRWFGGRHVNVQGFRAGPPLDWMVGYIQEFLGMHLTVDPPVRRHDTAGRVERRILPRRSRRRLVGTLAGEVGP